MVIMLPDHATCYRAISARDTRFDGHIFTGVKTTGIYCRPVCPARVPRSDNVIFYPSAAAAHEAGFRPCLRCRPETAPDTPAWRGTSAVIGRALRLIDDGALNDLSVAHLAMRLGVGDRHLRRLFLKHLGATPIAVAQTRRTLLAKQLLHETQLPMTEVALGSGFGSIRRFNEVFQNLFDRPPSAIRRGLAPEVSMVSSGEISLKLRFRPPYDWEGVAAFLSARLYKGVEAFVEGQYCRSFDIDGHKGIIFVGPGGIDWLNVRVVCTSLVVLPRLIARIRRSFDLAADTATIGADLSKDPKLAPLVERYPGLRVPVSWSSFEGLVRAILGQQITVAAAIGLGHQLLSVCAEPLPEALAQRGPVTHVFPSAKAVAELDLAFLSMPNTRKQTLGQAAQVFSEDPGFFAGEFSEIRTRLLSLKGVGPWTADCTLLRALGDPDAMPSGDVALIKAFCQIDSTVQSQTDLALRAQNWQPWRSYAAQYLWRSLTKIA
jgi:AraC family transcriptional regulator, regulatory protein of adaptative response / DNA-3-methyladenine glycosylase II